MELRARAMIEAVREAGPPIVRGIADCELTEMIDAAMSAARPTADLGEDGELRRVADAIERNITWQTGEVFKGNRKYVNYLEVASALLSRSGDD